MPYIALIDNIRELGDVLLGKLSSTMAVSGEQRFLDGLDFEDQEADSLEKGSVLQKDVSASVLYTLDWTIGTLLQQVKDEAIDMSPDFQRREAWTDERKSQYIESILLNLPTPQLILAEEASGRFIVIDGKQRLLTLSRFFGALGQSFNLSGLEVLTDLNDTEMNSYDHLASIGLIRKMTNYPVRTIVVRNATPDELYLIFLRFNSGSVKLSPQELRSALSRGAATNFINSRSGDLKGLQILLGTNGPDFRMRDAELLLRFLAIRMDLENYSGNLKRYLDNYLVNLNARWAEVQSYIESLTEFLDKSLRLFYEVQGRHFGRKWTGNGYERRINRALLDPIAFFGMNVQGLEAYERHRDSLDDIVKACCCREEFMGAITSTTKTTRSLFNRLNVFAHEFHRITGHLLGTLEFDEASNRILHS